MPVLFHINSFKSHYVSITHTYQNYCVDIRPNQPTKIHRGPPTLVIRPKQLEQVDLIHSCLIHSRRDRRDLIPMHRDVCKDCVSVHPSVWHLRTTSNMFVAGTVCLRARRPEARVAVKPANVSNSFRASGSQRNDRVASSRVNISCVLSSHVKTQPSNLINFY